MIVVGLGFGDEGKGLTTSYLCSKKKDPIVVRFNGGHQAGHTVVYDGTRHVFSNFGSGTLQNAPTYWSEFCTFDPVGVIKEHNILKRKVELTVNPYCPVVTPFDKQHNQILESSLPLAHGSCGVGFGSTIQREEDNYRLNVRDLMYDSVFFEKLRLIKLYYEARGIEIKDAQFLEFIKAAQDVRDIIAIKDDIYLAKNRERLIFEGAQGILLDANYGFFPNVTRSNCGSLNARRMHRVIEEVYYVTRCYQTRHGNGFMTNESNAQKLGLKGNRNETNQPNDWQGPFRVGELDPDLINYALDCDKNASQGLERNLVITCCDQVEDFQPEKLLPLIKTTFNKVFVSYGPSLTDIKQIR